MFLYRESTSLFNVVSCSLPDLLFGFWKTLTSVTVQEVAAQLWSHLWPSFQRWWGSPVSWVVNRKQSDEHLWKAASYHRKAVILKNKKEMYTCEHSLKAYVAPSVPRASREAQKVRDTMVLWTRWREFCWHLLWRGTCLSSRRDLGFGFQLLVVIKN